MKNEIKGNTSDLWNLVNQHKALFEFWKSFQGMKSINDIQERIDYIKKNKCNQRNELETLLWIINEIGDEKNEF